MLLPNLVYKIVFIFVCNVRSHFHMEIDILEKSLDILAIWHAGGEFANVPCYFANCRGLLGPSHAMICGWLFCP